MEEQGGCRRWVAPGEEEFIPGKMVAEAVAKSQANTNVCRSGHWAAGLESQSKCAPSSPSCDPPAHNPPIPGLCAPTHPQRPHSSPAGETWSPPYAGDPLPPLNTEAGELRSTGVSLSCPRPSAHLGGAAQVLRDRWLPQCGAQREVPAPGMTGPSPSSGTQVSPGWIRLDPRQSLALPRPRVCSSCPGRGLPARLSPTPG